MLTEEQRGHLCVVLVRARNPSNIGAVARAMHGFGFTDLRLVNDYSVPFQDARSAIDASDILASAREFRSVAEAVADCRLVVGTTAVGERKQEHTIESPAGAAPMLASVLSTANHAALLFGSEKTGLSNDALSHCHSLVSIPMHVTPGMRHASMNLGQAVAVCLYELVREIELPPLLNPPPLPALADDLERVTDLVSEVLAGVGYAQRRPSSADPAEVRRMVRRLRLTQSDARRWIGVLRQILWKMGKASE